MYYPKNQESELSKELFLHPTSEYRGAPFWSWNDELEKEELCRQIDEFHEMGFGGFGESGMGSYHGKVGFDTFSHYKSIVDKKTWMDLPMRYQPYQKIYDKMIRMFLK